MQETVGFKTSFLPSLARCKHGLWLGPAVAYTQRNLTKTILFSLNVKFVLIFHRTLVFCPDIHSLLDQQGITLQRRSNTYTSTRDPDYQLT